MNEENELEKLVIENLEIVEQSRRLLSEIDRRFKDKLESILEPQFVFFFPTWMYTFGLHDKWCYVEIYPKNWEFEEAIASLSIDFHKWELGNKLTYLSYCANFEHSDPGIFFNLNKKFMEKFNVDLRKVRYYINAEEWEKLDAAGIKLKNDRLYHPYQIDIKKISADWPNLTADSIKPMLDALQNISQVTDIFDALVKRLTGQK